VYTPSPRFVNSSCRTARITKGEALLASGGRDVLRDKGNMTAFHKPFHCTNIPRLSVDPFVLDSRSFAPFRFRHDLARRPSMPRAGRCFSNALAHGSVIPWQHINLLGEYDFSDEKLRDSVGIRSPKLTPSNLFRKRVAPRLLWASAAGERQRDIGDRAVHHGHNPH